MNYMVSLLRYLKLNPYTLKGTLIDPLKAPLYIPLWYLKLNPLKRTQWLGRKTRAVPADWGSSPAWSRHAVGASEKRGFTLNGIIGVPIRDLYRRLHNLNRVLGPIIL